MLHLRQCARLTVVDCGRSACKMTGIWRRQYSRSVDLIAARHARLHALQGPDMHPIIARLAMEDELETAPEWEISPELHPLSHVLSDISRPAISYRGDDHREFVNIKLMSAGDSGRGKKEGRKSREMGKISKLALDKLRTLASPSSFGQGTELVHDESVRKGLEIPAAKLALDLDTALSPKSSRVGTVTGRDAFANLARHIQDDLFPSQPVKLVLYKLAMHEQSGHFNAYRDSTHADSHRATLLIGCGIAGENYEGGELLIPSGGATDAFDLEVGDQVAFHTDLTHAPVAAGVRVTLQFDIYLEDDSVSRPHTVACIPASSPSPPHQEYTPSLVWAGPDDPTWHSAFSRYEVPTVAEPSALAAFVSQVSSLLSTPPEERNDRTRTVAFLLDHLYRQRSILPRYLKGSDDSVYRALVSADTKLSVRLLAVLYTIRQTERHKGLYYDDDDEDEEEEEDEEEDEDEDYEDWDPGYENVRVRQYQTVTLCPPFEGGVEPDIKKEVLWLRKKNASAMGYDKPVRDSEVDSVGDGPFDTAATYFAAAMFVSLADESPSDVPAVTVGGYDSEPAERSDSPP